MEVVKGVRSGGTLVFDCRCELDQAVPPLALTLRKPPGDVQAHKAHERTFFMLSLVQMSPFHPVAGSGGLR